MSKMEMVVAASAACCRRAGREYWLYAVDECGSAKYIGVESSVV
jgi:hypothetical protein